MTKVLFLQTFQPNKNEEAAYSFSDYSMINAKLCHFIFTLFTCVTIASNTSPLNGLNTIALYLTGYTTKPCPGCIIPAPILSIVVTATTKPYLKDQGVLKKSYKISIPT